jgi:hypothetical protein
MGFTAMKPKEELAALDEKPKQVKDNFRMIQIAD